MFLKLWLGQKMVMNIIIEYIIAYILVPCSENSTFSRDGKQIHICTLYSRLGQIFRTKKQVVVVAKYIEEPKLIIFNLFKLNCFAKRLLQQAICLISSSYPLLPGLVRPNKENIFSKSKKRLHF